MLGLGLGLWKLVSGGIEALGKLWENNAENWEVEDENWEI